MCAATVATAFTADAKLKRKIRRHFTTLGFTKANDGTLILPGSGKDAVRKLHSGQRLARLDDGGSFLARVMPALLEHFADGDEIEPAKIKLCLVRVQSGSEDSDLFRLASLTWSVPVSAGFGRRLRYLVWDEYHGRLAGIIALGDPVFNLSVRDNLIGWNSDDRSKRLVNILDAYVLGAVPPYNMLLGGKAVACLVRSREVYDDFAAAYGGSVGLISGKRKRANLLAVTTSSSMGRSSIYNRLRLNDQSYFAPIGYTLGWGHFHVTDRLFNEMRDYLRSKDHHYADKHKFGEGPNWRFRTIRTALAELGINQAVLRHGIQREVFLCTLAKNSTDILRTGTGKPNLSSLLRVSKICEQARERWIVPRAERRPEFRMWRRERIPELVGVNNQKKFARVGSA
jgi:Domain of unknown function (DUF4338)